MTCTYDIRWRHIYVKCPIMSGSHILDPQNPIFSFCHNFTKKYLFSKVRLNPDSARSDLSKEPIKSEYLCKNAKKKFSVKTGPKRQVSYSVYHFERINIINELLNRPTNWNILRNPRRHHCFSGIRYSIRIATLESTVLTAYCLSHY